MNCPGSIGEMIAGILICCMPSISITLRLWKDPIISFLSRSRRSLLSSVYGLHTASESVAKLNGAPTTREQGILELPRVYAGPTAEGLGTSWAVGRGVNTMQAGRNQTTAIEIQRTTEVTISRQ